MTPLYRLEQITKSYGKRAVLALDEIIIGQGEMLALIGPSGAGKSTLLRLLCLLEAPTEGIMLFDGVRIDGRPSLAVQRQITLVFQRPVLLDMSVRRNVGYGLRLRGERAADRVDALLEELGLTALAGARPGSLSGGELQRVAVARALVLRPRVLLLDEPTANLDPQNVAVIEEAIRRLHRDYGTTIIVATHNIHQARRLAQRTALLLEGRLIEIGATEQLLATPHDPRTAAFVSGAMVY